MSSPSPGERAIGKALKERAFERAYYFHGDDDFRKEEALRLLIDAAVDPATRDFNLEIRRGGELDAGVLGSLLGTPPMMAERRMLVVRDTGALKKDARAALAAYLENPAPDQLVLLVSPAGEKPDKTLENRATVVEFTPLAGDRVLRWIEKHATQVHGARISQDAAALLQSVAGDDLQQLSAEIDKLASYTRGEPIDEAAVTAVVGVRRGETLGDFLDAVLRRDATAALALVEHVLALPKTTGVNVVMALAAHMLAIGWGLSRREEGASAGVLAREYYDFLKTAGTFLGRSWGDAVKAFTDALDHWTIEEVDRALGLMLDTDCALKESRVSSEAQVIASLVLALCTRPVRGRRAA